MPGEIADRARQLGAEVAVTAVLAQAAAESDVLYITRIQKERFADEAEYARLKGAYVVDAQVVQAANRNEPAEPRNQPDTQELFTLPRETESGDRTASRKIVIIQQAAQAQPGVSQGGAPPGRDGFRQFAKRLGSLAVFAGMLLLVVWLAFPNLPSQQAIDEAPTPSLLRRALSGGGERSAAGRAPAVPSERRALGWPDGGR